jgi:SAM-dependent methyltransferase
MNKPPVHASNHEASAPEPWIVRFAAKIPPGGRVLDLACGRGRHTRFFLERGHPVTAVDIDLSGLAQQHTHPQLEALEADLEHGPWPLEGRRFAAVIVINYLWRAILPDIIAAVETGGLLLYATFGRGQERLGKPTNPDFLLEPGELLEAVRGELTVYAYEYGEMPMANGHPAVRQHLYARRELI